MGDDSHSAPCSRRSFLNGGAAFVAGGMIGSAAGIASAAAAQPNREAAELPWPWAKIDPIEAGRRSFHNYHEKGG
jgi:hypothetical protein